MHRLLITTFSCLQRQVSIIIKQMYMRSMTHQNDPTVTQRMDFDKDLQWTDNFQRSHVNYFWESQHPMMKKEKSYEIQ